MKVRYFRYFFGTVIARISVAINAYLNLTSTQGSTGPGQSPWCEERTSDKPREGLPDI